MTVFIASVCIVAGLGLILGLALALADRGAVRGDADPDADDGGGKRFHLSGAGERLSPGRFIDEQIGRASCRERV